MSITVRAAATEEEVRTGLRWLHESGMLSSPEVRIPINYTGITSGPRPVIAMKNDIGGAQWGTLSSRYPPWLLSIRLRTLTGVQWIVARSGATKGFSVSCGQIKFGEGPLVLVPKLVTQESFDLRTSPISVAERWSHTRQMKPVFQSTLTMWSPLWTLLVFGLKLILRNVSEVCSAVYISIQPKLPQFTEKLKSGQPEAEGGEPKYNPKISGPFICYMVLLLSFFLFKTWITAPLGLLLVIFYHYGNPSPVDYTVVPFMMAPAYVTNWTWSLAVCLLLAPFGLLHGLCGAATCMITCLSPSPTKESMLCRVLGLGCGSTTSTITLVPHYYYTRQSSWGYAVATVAANLFGLVLVDPLSLMAIAFATVWLLTRQWPHFACRVVPCSRCVPRSYPAEVATPFGRVTIEGKEFCNKHDYYCLSLAPDHSPPPKECRAMTKRLVGPEGNWLAETEVTYGGPKPLGVTAWANSIHQLGVRAFAVCTPAERAMVAAYAYSRQLTLPITTILLAEHATSRGPTFTVGVKGMAGYRKVAAYIVSLGGVAPPTPLQLADEEMEGLGMYSASQALVLGMVTGGLSAPTDEIAIMRGTGLGNHQVAYGQLPLEMVGQAPPIPGDCIGPRPLPTHCNLTFMALPQFIWDTVTQDIREALKTGGYFGDAREATRKVTPIQTPQLSKWLILTCLLVVGLTIVAAAYMDCSGSYCVSSLVIDDLHLSLEKTIGFVTVFWADPYSAIVNACVILLCYQTQRMSGAGPVLALQLGVFHMVYLGALPVFALLPVLLMPITFDWRFGLSLGIMGPVAAPILLLILWRIYQLIMSGVGGMVSLDILACTPQLITTNTLERIMESSGKTYWDLQEKSMYPNTTGSYLKQVLVVKPHEVIPWKGFRLQRCRYSLGPVDSRVAAVIGMSGRGTAYLLSTSEKESQWLTAAHCFDDETTQIAGLPVLKSEVIGHNAWCWTAKKGPIVEEPELMSHNEYAERMKRNGKGSVCVEIKTLDGPVQVFPLCNSGRMLSTTIGGDSGAPLFFEGRLLGVHQGIVGPFELFSDCQGTLHTPSFDVVDAGEVPNAWLDPIKDAPVTTNISWMAPLPLTNSAYVYCASICGGTQEQASSLTQLLAFFLQTLDGDTSLFIHGLLAVTSLSLHTMLPLTSLAITGLAAFPLGHHLLYDIVALVTWLLRASRCRSLGFIAVFASLITLGLGYPKLVILPGMGVHWSMDVVMLVMALILDVLTMYSDCRLPIPLYKLVGSLRWRVLNTPLTLSHPVRGIALKPVFQNPSLETLHDSIRTSVGELVRLAESSLLKGLPQKDERILQLLVSHLKNLVQVVIQKPISEEQSLVVDTGILTPEQTRVLRLLKKTKQDLKNSLLRTATQDVTALCLAAVEQATLRSSVKILPLGETPESHTRLGYEMVRLGDIGVLGTVYLEKEKWESLEETTTPTQLQACAGTYGFVIKHSPRGPEVHCQGLKIAAKHEFSGAHKVEVSGVTLWVNVSQRGLLEFLTLNLNLFPRRTGDLGTQRHRQLVHVNVRGTWGILLKEKTHTHITARKDNMVVMSKFTTPEETSLEMVNSMHNRIRYPTPHVVFQDTPQVIHRVVQTKTSMVTLGDYAYVSVFMCPGTPWEKLEWNPNECLENPEEVLEKLVKNQESSPTSLDNYDVNGCRFDLTTLELPEKRWCRFEFETLSIAAHIRRDTKMVFAVGNKSYGLYTKSSDMLLRLNEIALTQPFVQWQGPLVQYKGPPRLEALEKLLGEATKSPGGNQLLSDWSPTLAPGPPHLGTSKITPTVFTAGAFVDDTALQNVYVTAGTITNVMSDLKAKFVTTCIPMYSMEWKLFVGFTRDLLSEGPLIPITDELLMAPPTSVGPCVPTTVDQRTLAVTTCEALQAVGSWTTTGKIIPKPALETKVRSRLVVGLDAVTVAALKLRSKPAMFKLLGVDKPKGPELVTVALNFPHTVREIDDYVARILGGQRPQLIISSDVAKCDNSVGTHHLLAGHLHAGEAAEDPYKEEDMVWLTQAVATHTLAGRGWLLGGKLGESSGDSQTSYTNSLYSIRIQLALLLRLVMTTEEDVLGLHSCVRAFYIGGNEAAGQAALVGLRKHVRVMIYSDDVLMFLMTKAAVKVVTPAKLSELLPGLTGIPQPVGKITAHKPSTGAPFLGRLLTLGVDHVELPQWQLRTDRSRFKAHLTYHPRGGLDVLGEQVVGVLTSAFLESVYDPTWFNRTKDKVEKGLKELEVDYPPLPEFTAIARSTSCWPEGFLGLQTAKLLDVCICGGPRVGCCTDCVIELPLCALHLVQHSLSGHINSQDCHCGDVATGINSKGEPSCETHALKLNSQLDAGVRFELMRGLPYHWSLMQGAVVAMLSKQAQIVQFPNVVHPITTLSVGTRLSVKIGRTWEPALVDIDHQVVVAAGNLEKPVKAKPVPVGVIPTIEQCLVPSLGRLVQGPPGTGKTTTLMRDVYEEQKTRRVVVVSSTNNSLDNIFKGLRALGCQSLFWKIPKLRAYDYPDQVGDERTATVVLCTAGMMTFPCGLLVVDEFAQVPADTLIKVLGLSRHAWLFGDPKQLPAVGSPVPFYECLVSIAETRGIFSQLGTNYRHGKETIDMYAGFYREKIMTDKTSWVQTKSLAELTMDVLTSLAGNQGITPYRRHLLPGWKTVDSAQGSTFAHVILVIREVNEFTTHTNRVIVAISRHSTSLTIYAPRIWYMKVNRKGFNIPYPPQEQALALPVKPLPKAITITAVSMTPRPGVIHLPHPPFVVPIGPDLMHNYAVAVQSVRLPLPSVCIALGVVATDIPLLPNVPAVGTQGRGILTTDIQATSGVIVSFEPFQGSVPAMGAGYMQSGLPNFNGEGICPYYIASRDEKLGPTLFSSGAFELSLKGDVPLARFGKKLLDHFFLGDNKGSKQMGQHSMWSPNVDPVNLVVSYPPVMAVGVLPGKKGPNTVLDVLPEYLAPKLESLNETLRTQSGNPVVTIDWTPVRMMTWKDQTTYPTGIPQVCKLPLSETEGVPETWEDLVRDEPLPSSVAEKYVDLVSSLKGVLNFPMKRKVSILHVGARSANGVSQGDLALMSLFPEALVVSYDKNSLYSTTAKKISTKEEIPKYGPYSLVISDAHSGKESLGDLNEVLQFAVSSLYYGASLLVKVTKLTIEKQELDLECLTAQFSKVTPLVSSARTRSTETWLLFQHRVLIPRERTSQNVLLSPAARSRVSHLPQRGSVGGWNTPIRVPALDVDSPVLSRFIVDGSNSETIDELLRSGGLLLIPPQLYRSFGPYGELAYVQRNASLFVDSLVGTLCDGRHVRNQQLTGSFCVGQDLPSSAVGYSKREPDSELHQPRESHARPPDLPLAGTLYATTSQTSRPCLLAHSLPNTLSKGVHAPRWVSGAKKAFENIWTFLQHSSLRERIIWVGIRWRFV
ncbi:1ab protein [Nanhai ghost shark arterivirus]|uniref:Replicase polyprotein 1ab n=1 Tax=Nanhai ghost shark arterivirus TaxID=2116441 RepID=A0A2P1GMU6_9NIDO|nr:1ab protein [Nanhai ghost shark arterivirus]AVM87326.1 1ab protein [Nanhai ghost shark arterivirus]